MLWVNQSPMIVCHKQVTWVPPSIMLTMKPRIANKSLSSTCLFWCPLPDQHLFNHHSIIGVLLRQVTKDKPACLSANESSFNKGPNTKLVFWLLYCSRPRVSHVAHFHVTWTRCKLMLLLLFEYDLNSTYYVVAINRHGQV